MIYENTRIGDFSHTSHCIVAESCKVGSGVKINKLPIIGAEWDTGDFANIHSGSRIWPKIKIAANSVIHGIRKH
ncbi:hypothetical protein E3I90_00090 [Candidatus Bathyarchaeota archaeon]|nr:MAG: hypothetical protein E3I90_00090 [Candidatus Bathyarchaeota archaeon]